MLTIGHNKLATADLYVDAKYEGSRFGNAGDDPLPLLLGINNQGGFRYLGAKESPRLIVLTTSLADPEWPDELNSETGVFTYFGDNKKPGRELHDTPRFGNLLLRDIFNATHTGNNRSVPPILVFSGTGEWRDMIFRGLAVPGAPGLSQLEDLVAVWKVSAGSRFQNYCAKFTILDVPRIPREWVMAIQNGTDPLQNSPSAWSTWIQLGRYTPLRARRALEIRNKAEQLPQLGADEEALSAIRSHFANAPHSFEPCAAEITRMALRNVSSIDLTRPSRDGGRDAIGCYEIGVGESSISVDFVIEAKCYAASNSVGVRELSRLISRLRHRQFGVMVTTSWIHGQAYREIKDDAHPIIIISGGDIIKILKSYGISTTSKVQAWLLKDFPLRPT